jgi:hypothetical protein
MPSVLSLRERFHHSTEHITDDRAKQQQNSGDDNCHQDKHQPVLEKTLPLFVRQKEHFFPLSFYCKQQKDDEYTATVYTQSRFLSRLDVPHKRSERRRSKVLVRSSVTGVYGRVQLLRWVLL